MANYGLGLDLSHWNQGVKWNLIKTPIGTPEGLKIISEVNIKVSEGIGGFDPMRINHSNGAHLMSLDIGFYHFAVPANSPSLEINAQSQAQTFIKGFHGLAPATKLPVLDLEVNPTNLSQSDYLQWVKAFLYEMNIQGFPKIIIYGSEGLLNEYLPANHGLSNPLWVADYAKDPPRLPNGWSSFIYWQFTEKGVHPAIPGNLDLSYTNG